MEEALIKKLVKVSLDGAFRHFHAVNSFGLERGVVVDFDPVDPLQHQDTARNILVIHFWDVDSWIVLEHLLEAFGIGCFGDEVNLFVHGAFKFVINSHQINKLMCVKKARNQADHKLECTQIRAYKLINIGPLNFDCNLFTCSGEYSLMYLAERGGGGGFAF